MASGPRAYGVAVERKLYRVARGTCYFPDCTRAIMFEVNDEPVCDVEIAHIRGAEKGSARYDENMSDAQRAAFPNLILLCSGHHKLVDRDDTTYRVELLEEWKAANEDDDLAALAGAGLNEDTLAAVLEEIVGKLRPRREIAVELECGVILPAGTGGVMTLPNLATLERTIASSPGWDRLPRVLVTRIRNTGSAAVEIEAVDLCFVLAAPDDAGAEPETGPSSETRLACNDDFPGQNPRLPYRMADGSATSWFTKFWHVDFMNRLSEFNSRTLPSIRSEVRLATGEVIPSPPFILNSDS